MQFRSFRYTHCTGIVIRYIASECVRLRSIPLVPVVFLYYEQTQGQVYAYLIQQKIMWAYYILCVLWYAYYVDSKSVDIPTFLLL